MNLEQIINSDQMKHLISESKDFDVLHIDATADIRGIDFDLLLCGKGFEDEPFRWRYWIDNPSYECVSGMDVTKNHVW